MFEVSSLFGSIYQDFSRAGILEQTSFLISLTALFGAPGGALAGLIARRMDRRSKGVLQAENKSLSAALENREKRLGQLEGELASLTSAYNEKCPSQICERAISELAEDPASAYLTIKYGIDEIAPEVSWLCAEFGGFLLEHSGEPDVLSLAAAFLHTAVFLGQDSPDLQGLFEEAKEAASRASSKSPIRYDPLDERFEPHDYLGRHLDPGATINLAQQLGARADREILLGRARMGERILNRSCAILTAHELIGTPLGTAMQMRHLSSMYDCGYFEFFLEHFKASSQDIAKIALSNESLLAKPFLELVDAAANASFMIGDFVESENLFSKLVQFTRPEEEGSIVWLSVWRQGRAIALRKLGKCREALRDQLALLLEIKATLGPESGDAYWTRLIVCLCLGEMGLPDKARLFKDILVSSWMNQIDSGHHIGELIQEVAQAMEDPRIFIDAEYCRTLFGALEGPKPYRIGGLRLFNRDDKDAAWSSTPPRDPQTWRWQDRKNAAFVGDAEDTIVRQLIPVSA